MTILKEDNGDAVAGVDTRYTMSVGDVFRGTLTHGNEDGTRVDDTDWIRVKLTAGTIYRINLEGVGTTAEDTQFHLSLLDSSGDNILSTVSGSDGMVDVHRVSATGTYYLKVEGGGEDADVWDYQVSVVENTTPEGTYDEIADYLTNGYWEGDGRPRRAFDVEPGGTLTADITALTPAGQQLARWALEAWTSVTGIGFEFVDGDAHITFDDKNDGTLGHARVTSWTPSDDGTYLIISSHVNIREDSLPLHATIDSYAFSTYIHEIGHALGLGHPGPYDGEGFTYSDHAKFLNDSDQATAMSYFSQRENTYIEASYAYPVTPMIADIIAIQNLYGTPIDINPGDTVYGVNSNVGGYPGLLFSRWTGELNPFVDIDVGDFSAPTFADLDDDGDLDLVAGESDGAVYYYEDTGSRSQSGFTERIGAANPLAGIDVSNRSNPTFADLDNDGDLDLVVGEHGYLNYYENTGSRSQPDFRERTDTANPLKNVQWYSHSVPSFADLDNDGDLDLVVGEYEGILHYYENTGSRSQPGFTERTGAANPLAGIEVDYNSAPTFADLDGDGDLDLVVGEWYGALHYYENTGTRSQPNFTERTGAANPLDGIGVDYASAPVFADLDGDGDLDLILGEREGHLYYYENTGTRTEASFTPLQLSQSVALTLYDNGGNDTLDLRTDTADQRVDLRPEGISDVYGLVGNLVIARGTVIEHFIAGSGNDKVTGNTAANRLEGRDGNDNLWGNGGDDVLEGGAGADRLYGGAGMDTVSYWWSDAGVTVNLEDGMSEGGHAEGDVIAEVENVIGSDYRDVLRGDSGANQLSGGAGNDGLWGSSGDDVLEGGAGADRLYGGAGEDTVAYWGSEAGVTVNLEDGTGKGGHAEGDVMTDVENIIGSVYDDTLTGNDAANWLEGGAGADRLYGGAGDDWVVYWLSDAGVTVNLEDGTGKGGQAEGDVMTDVENIIGSVYDDTLTGNDAANWLEGGAGADRLYGGAGDDWVVYWLSDAGVTVNLEDGTGKGGHAEGDVITDVENIIGSDHDDTLTGNDAANWLDGDSGDDMLEGGPGADRLDGGAGMDTVSYQGSDAGVTVKLREGTGKRGHAEGDVIAEVENVIGSDHNDTLVGDSLDNLLTGNAGNDLLWGSAGNDLLIGGPGADRLVGNSGHDTAAYTHSPTGVTVRLHNLSATGGDATGDTFPYKVDVAWTDIDGVEQTESLPDVEHLSGSAHDDVLAGDRRDNVIDGGAGHDTLYGGPGGGDDRLDGGPGDDRLYGGQGRDRLAGAAGDDRLVGGPGADVFVVAPGEGEDTVTDFTDGEDRIDLTAFGLAGIDDITTTTTTDGVAFDLTDSGGGTILLADFAMANLDATDFIV